MKNEHTTRPKVRAVKFTAQEMACDPPSAETEKWAYVGRGADAIFGKPVKRRKSIELDSDLAAVFRDSASVNRALRKLLEAVPMHVAGTNVKE